MVEKHEHKHTTLRHFMAEAGEQCEGQGEKLTPLRRQILEIIYKQKKPVKAYELIRLISTRDHSAKPPTVYRTLDFLLKVGLIHRVETLDAFMACCHPRHEATSQLLICGACGDVQETESNSFAAAIKTLGASRKFQPQSQTIEIQGLCSSCHEGQSHV
jgi:Fur family zinc uptake transcriptional regulator